MLIWSHFLYQNTVAVNNLENVAFNIFSPDLPLSFFTILRHICGEKISPNPFFHSVVPSVCYLQLWFWEPWIKHHNWTDCFTKPSPYLSPLFLPLTFFFQPQNTASQANAVFDQWRASSFGATTAGRKDQTPNAPALPANDPFAEFMKMQSTSSNSLEALPASQQAAMPAAIEQRSNIPQQPASMFPMQPHLITNTVPSQSQAFYLQPQENEHFPKNPWEFECKVF